MIKGLFSRRETPEYKRAVEVENKKIEEINAKYSSKDEVWTKRKELEEYLKRVSVPPPSHWGTLGPTIHTSSPMSSPAHHAFWVSTPELIDKVSRFCLDNDLWIKRTGSQLIEGIEPNDYDFVVEDTECVMKCWLERNGYQIGGSDTPESEFTSWKNGKVNIIVCNSRPFYQKYLMATELLKQLQPKTKEERVDIFDTVMGRNKEKYEVAF